MDLRFGSAQGSKKGCLGPGLEGMLVDWSPRSLKGNLDPANIY